MESPGYKPSLSEIAYRRIKEMILSLTLKPGSSLTEMGLIEQLGMSRTPIREALYRLQQERFVELTPRKGWFVSEIKLQDIQQLFVIREALEGIATRQATLRAPDDALAAMAKKLATLEQYLRTDELNATDAGDEIHTLIFAHADNPYISSIMTLYLDRLQLFHVIAMNLPGRKLQSWLEHRQILTAMQARDADAAEQAMRLHIRSSLQSILEGLMQQPGFPSPGVRLTPPISQE